MADEEAGGAEGAPEEGSAEAKGKEGDEGEGQEGGEAAEADGTEVRLPLPRQELYAWPCHVVQSPSFFKTPLSVCSARRSA